MKAFLITGFVNVYLLDRNNTTHYKLKINFGQILAKIFWIIRIFYIRYYVVAVMLLFAPYIANFNNRSLYRRELKKTLLNNYNTGNVRIT
jgi:hypothetical protein